MNITGVLSTINNHTLFRNDARLNRGCPYMHKARLHIAFRHNWILARNDCIEEKCPTCGGRLLSRVTASCLFAIGPWGHRTRKGSARIPNIVNYSAEEPPCT